MSSDLLVRSQIRAELWIYSTDSSTTEPINKLPITQMGMDYSINSIPTATVQVPVSNRVASSLAINIDETATSNLLDYTRSKPKAKIIWYAKGEFPVMKEQPADGQKETQSWPDGPIVVFDGRIHAAQTNVTDGSYHLALTLKHWLAYLNSASVLSTASHPQNNQQMAFSTLIPSAIMSTETPGRIQIFSSAVGNHFRKDREGIKKDFWGNGLKKMFVKLASNTAAVYTNALKECVGSEKPTPDANVLTALSRLVGVIDSDPTYSRELPENVPPLALNDGMSGLSESAVRELSQAIGSQLLDSISSQTIWSQLVAYGNAFMFAVVPRINDAIIAPMCMSTSDVNGNTVSISRQNILTITTSVNAPTSIKAVALCKPFTSMTGASSPQADEAARMGKTGFAGCFVPAEESLRKGLVYIAPVPAWLNRVDVTAGNVKRTAKPQAGMQSATTPKPVQQDVRASNPAPAAATKQVFQLYAEAIYYLERFQESSVNITCPINLEIAPGSHVIFDSNNELDNRKHGIVLGVSIGINAQNESAAMSVQIGYARGYNTIDNDIGGQRKHPFFNETFQGARLTDEF